MRHTFGGDIAAYTFTTSPSGDVTAIGGATLTFWPSQTGGPQIVDLSLANDGSIPIDHTTSSTDPASLGMIPRFFGPDGVTQMWASANGGPRALIVANDGAGVADANAAGITQLTAQLAAHIAGANPHGTRLVDLDDVDQDAAADGQILAYDLASGRWHAATVPGLAGVVMLAGAQTITGPKTFDTGDPATSRIVVQASAGQTADLLATFCTAPDGSVRKATHVNARGELRVVSAAPNSVAVRVKGRGGQAHIQEWTDQSDTALAWVEPDGRVRAPNLGHTFVIERAGSLGVSAGKSRRYNDTGVPLTIRAVRASVGTAPVGGPVVVDINRNGASIFTAQVNQPSIVAGAVTSGKVTAIGNAALADGDYLTVDVDAVGSTTPGADLAVQVLAY